MKRTITVALLTAALCTAAAARAADPLAPALLDLQRAWAQATYRTADDKVAAAFEQLTTRARALAERYPGRAEPLVWEAITLSTRAGKVGGLHALGWAKQARDLLLRAEQIDPDVLSGSIYTSLGSLYYKVPGWPIGFGDKKKAERYLRKAVEVNPSGIDPNYFLADYLASRGRYAEALEYAKRAVDAPPRPQRPVADAGRRAEAQALLQRIQTRLADNGHRQGGALWN